MVDNNEIYIEEMDNEFKDRIILTLRPAYKFIYCSFLYIVLFSVPVILSIIVLIMKADYTNGKAPMGCIILAIMWIIIKAFIDKKKYNNSRYDFYKRKVVFNDGFLEKYNQEVEYKDIVAIVMKQTYIQKLSYLGTIYIKSKESSVIINDVEDVIQTYEKIRKIIKL